MIELCISGVPGTGKSTVCEFLTEMGYKCNHLNDVADETGCIQEGEVDVDCLKERIPGEISIVESHYSHALDCRKVVILECDPGILEERLLKRGYSASKVQENIESQSSDIIYYESLELRPSGRIFRIDTTGLSPWEVARRITMIIEETSDQQ